MSHSYALVVIPGDTDPGVAVEDAMRPYSEDINETSGFWDWWSIGGRWTGVLDGYEPDKDIRNIETCWLCHGTGVRSDMAVANGCNGCRGLGVSVKWPTKWVSHPGDIATVADVIRAGRMPFTLVTPDGAFHSRTWNGDDFDDTEPALVEAFNALDPDTKVAVVDYHS